MYYYDIFGWFTNTSLEGRSTTIAPPNLSETTEEGALRANWTGYEWVELPYVEAVLPDPAPTPAPSVCTPAQGLVALFALKGITEDNILEAINLIPDPVDRYTAQISYTRATEWRRESPTMQAMAGLLELTGQDLDELFTYAAEVLV